MTKSVGGRKTLTKYLERMGRMPLNEEHAKEIMIGMYEETQKRLTSLEHMHEFRMNRSRFAKIMDALRGR